MFNFTTPFILICEDGCVIVFDTMKALREFVQDNRIVVNAYHREWFGEFSRRPITNFKNQPGLKLRKAIWIVRDDRGQIVVPADWKIERHWHVSLYEKDRINAANLGLAIPGTGRRGRRNYYRMPRGNGAKRAACEAHQRLDIDEVKVNRRIKVPSSNWDDIRRSDIYERNWKRHRKTQWKEV